MKNKEKMQNKILIVSSVILGLILAVFLANKVLVNVIADRVVEKLQRDYVPGPYDPGFDPDKVNPSVFRSDYSTTRSEN